MKSHYYLIKSLLSCPRNFVIDKYEFTYMHICMNKYVYKMDI